jgi:hypothetical protein
VWIVKKNFCTKYSTLIKINTTSETHVLSNFRNYTRAKKSVYNALPAWVSLVPTVLENELVINIYKFNSF